MGGSARPLSLSPTSLSVFAEAQRTDTVVRPDVEAVGRAHSSFQGPTYVVLPLKQPLSSRSILFK